MNEILNLNLLEPIQCLKVEESRKQARQNILFEERKAKEKGKKDQLNHLFPIFSVIELGKWASLLQSFFHCKLTKTQGKIPSILTLFLGIK